MNPAATKFSLQHWGVLLAACIGLYVTLLDVNILGIARPTIQRSLALSLSQLQWVSSAYSMTVAVLILPGGKLGDLFGRKPVFLIGMTIFLVGSLISSCAGFNTFGVDSGFQVLLVGRLLQGLGAALLLPAGLSILSAMFAEPHRSRAFGIYSAVTGLGIATAPLLGGWIIQHFNWQWIFLINVPLCLIGMLLAKWAVSRSNPGNQRRLDVLGALTSSTAIFLFMAALIETNRATVSRMGILLTLVCAGLALLLFVNAEKRAADPILKLGAFSLPNFAGSVGVAFFINAAGLALFFFLTLYFQNCLNMQPMVIGLLLMPFNVPVFLVALIAGRLLPSMGARTLMTVAMVTLSLGLLLIERSLSLTAGPYDFVPGLFAMGVGVGLANPAVNSTAMAALSQEDAGMASGTLVFSRQIGNAFGVAILSFVLSVAYQWNARVYAREFSEQVNGTWSEREVVTGLLTLGPIVSPGSASAPHAVMPNEELHSVAMNSFLGAVIAVVRVALGLAILGLYSARLVGSAAGRPKGQRSG